MVELFCINKGNSEKIMRAKNILKNALFVFYQTIIKKSVLFIIK
jgi:hypothetical protein